MPLAFNSSNKGEIVFGFFNIDTDMLLMENYFFYASDFCSSIVEFAKSEKPEKFDKKFNGFVINEREKIGDLMGAIHGVRFIGFVGEVYKKFPFPANLENFKQSPESYKNRKVIDEIIIKYGKPYNIQLKAKDREILFEKYEFTKEQFFELINYVWLGGYPRWKNNIKPDYVVEMEKEIKQSKNNFLLKELRGA